MSDQQIISSFGALLRAALGDALMAEAGTGFLAMCADDIVVQFPYAPVGTVRELRGKAMLEAYLPKVGELVAFDTMGTPVTHASKDGETYVLEFSCKGHGVQNGVAYDQDYIAVIRVQDALIVHFRDYWNPLLLIEAAGGVEALSSNFQEFINV